MPVTSPAITAAIIAAGPDLAGQTWPFVALAIGNAVAAWVAVPSNLTMTGVTAGAAGGGSVNGKFFVPPNPLPVPAAMIGAGLIGQNATTVGRAVGIGIANAFNANALYTGASTGVGVGADTSKVTVSNMATLIVCLTTAFTAANLVGLNIAALSIALGTGISTLLLAGSGVGFVTGAGGPSPAMGSSFSKVY